MTEEWRELETLVRDLERIFAGDQVTVKSPDFLPDRETGGLREVDVSIRARVGSAEILVIVECRNRDQVEDVTWIEQIAMKASDIKASKAIAVTSRRFTANAVTKAKAKGIELRTFAEISNNVAVQWLGGIANQYELGHIAITCKRTPVESLVVEGAIIPDGESRIDHEVLISLQTGEKGSPFAVLPLKEVFSECATSLPFGEPTPFKTAFQPMPGMIGVMTDFGVAEITNVEVDVVIERRIAEATSSSFQYINQDGDVIADGTRLAIDHYGIPLVINYARQAGQELGFVVSREDHDKDRVVAFDLIFTSPEGEPVARSGVLLAAEPQPRRRNT